MTSGRGRSIIISLGMAIAVCGCASTGQQEVYPARIINSEKAQVAGNETGGASESGDYSADGIETNSDYVFKPSDTVEAENSYVLMKNEMTISSGISKGYDYGYLSRDNAVEAGENDSSMQAGKESGEGLTAKEDAAMKDGQNTGGQEILSGQKTSPVSDQAASGGEIGSEQKAANGSIATEQKAAGGSMASEQAVADGQPVTEQVTEAGSVTVALAAADETKPSGTGTVEEAKSSEQSTSEDPKQAAESKPQEDQKTPEDSKDAEAASAAVSEGQAAADENAGSGSAKTPCQDEVYSDEQMAQICAFYDGTVFAGDSVMLGFRNYSKKSTDPMLSKLSFLAAGSLSLHNSFWEVSSKSVHPLYQGEQHPIWESIQMMGAKKAFLFFGINDVVYNLDESMSLYAQLVEKIKEYSPDIDITIISATYTLKDKGKGKLNNANLAEFNRSAKALADQNGWGFVDIANPLSDGEGNLLPQYCSDGFLHESNKAYEVWADVLKKYAADRLGIKGSAAETAQAVQ
ncbi:MAG: hypothetical protein K6E91_12995 [Butyrivibrio sp.]|nr:hypothetical protein [Butyrivibrio sp.]